MMFKMTKRYKVFTECNNCFNLICFTLNKPTSQKGFCKIGSVFTNKICVKCNKLQVLKVVQKIEVPSNE